MLLPSGHFFVSARKILPSCADVTVVTPFCFETTTAMWCAKHGLAANNPNRTMAAAQDDFRFILAPTFRLVQLRAEREITKVTRKELSVKNSSQCQRSVNRAG